MATNIELEKQLNAAQKEIQALRAEVDALKSSSAATVAEEIRVLKVAIERTFRAAGFSAEWYRAIAATINTTELAASMNTAAPTPISAVPTAEDWQNISKELLGRPLMTLPEIQQMIQKYAATTAKG